MQLSQSTTALTESVIILRRYGRQSVVSAKLFKTDVVCTNAPRGFPNCIMFRLSARTHTSDLARPWLHRSNVKARQWTQKGQGIVELTDSIYKQCGSSMLPFMFSVILVSAMSVWSRDLQDYFVRKTNTIRREDLLTTVYYYNYLSQCRGLS